MIHYHGGPITPNSAQSAIWTARHAFISFARPEHISHAAEVCQSFAIDNGAFTHFQNGGGEIDVPAYVAFVQEWERHPGFDWALIPDVIDGTEDANDLMMARYRAAGGNLLAGVPVWHLHESLDRLVRLAHAWPRVALGSSGQFRTVGTPEWWARMSDAMDRVCDAGGRPLCKLHGLRMLNPTVFSHLPLASADSTNAAQNHNRERRRYRLSPAFAAAQIVGRIEAHASAPLWNRTMGVQQNPELLG